MSSLMKTIQELLSNVKEINGDTRMTDSLDAIDFSENPLNPYLLAYCFDVILGFNVKYRIAEKVNYIIEFDYKGTFAKVEHSKLDYNISIDYKYKKEFVLVLQTIKPLLEQLFMQLGENAILNNQFTMKNETLYYFDKLSFYENRIESLKKREEIIRKKTSGRWEIVKMETYTEYKPKCQDYLLNLHREMQYGIEAYIGSFYSALDHVLILLFPFTHSFSSKESYYKQFIHNPRWNWIRKINDVCENKIGDDIINELKRIREIYRNPNEHGSFSREMMAYVQIPSFGRYPIYIGKDYLKGFIDGNKKTLSYDTYLEAKSIFNSFWDEINKLYAIPMMFIKNGLPIPVDADIYLRDIHSCEDAQSRIDKLLYEIDNQSNMDW